MMLKRFLKSRIWLAVWQVFIRFYAFLFLPLLAWGVDDLTAFFSNHSRLVFGIIVLLQALLGAWQAAILPPRPKQEQPVDLTHWQIDLYHVVFLIAAYGDRRNILTWTENPLVRWVGLGIYLVGVGLSTWANLTWVNHLRRGASSTGYEPALLSNGPYQYIRHPGLLCLIIYSLGFALAFRSWSGLALLLPLTAGFMHRIRTLESDYAEQYKLTWLKRQHTSKRLFPFVY